MDVFRDYHGRFLRHTKNSKQFISKMNSGRAPSGGSFKKGHIPWTMGVGHTEKTKKKISESHKRIAKRGKENHLWKGGRTIHNGYVYLYLPNHPCSSYGQYSEHRFVVEQKFGRFLTPREFVHHINGKRDDNRIENLQLMSNVEHSRLHAINKKN